MIDSSNCTCPNAACERHGNCDACNAHHEGNGYCKRSSVIYIKDMSKITADMLNGFFAGWQNKPNPTTHIRIMQNSYRAIVAVDATTGMAVGFINSISDGILSAYIPLLEVLPEYRGKGIGRWLVRLMKQECKHLYMLDICHDEEIAPFYAKFEPTGQGRSTLFRNYEAQGGMNIDG